MALVSLFRLSVPCVILTLALAGCGSEDGSPTVVVAEPDAEPDPELIGDNWDFRVEGFEDKSVILECGAVEICVDRTGWIYAMNGSVDLSGPSASARLAVWGGCVSEGNARLTLTGTREGSALNLSGTEDGITVRIEATLSPDLRSFEGTLTLASGGCGFDHPPVPMTGQRVDLGGTWSDDVVTLNLTVATSPTERGSFDLTGTASIADEPCLAGGGTITNGARGRFVFPDLKDANGSTVILLNGEVTSDGQEMHYAYDPVGGSCSTSGSGTLTRR